MAKKKSAKSRADKSDVDATLTRNGGLSYLEIPAVDVRRSAEFYKNVFGWNIEGLTTDQPKFSDRTGHLIGRWKSGRAISRKPGFLPYFYVDDIRNAVKRAIQNGGEIVKPVFPEGDLWVSILRDPAGNVIGLWQKAE
jgi:predicted enzyme related to lactoylglutathione lyase